MHGTPCVPAYIARFLILRVERGEAKLVDSTDSHPHEYIVNTYLFDSKDGEHYVVINRLTGEITNYKVERTPRLVRA
jgi:hypothetical protein